MALRIRNIEAEVQKITFKNQENRVLIEGDVHSKISYVGNNNVVQTKNKNIDFVTTMEIKDLKSKDEANGKADIKHVTGRLTEDGSTVNQLVILQIVVNIPDEGLTLNKQILVEDSIILSEEKLSSAEPHQTLDSKSQESESQLEEKIKQELRQKYEEKLAKEEEKMKNKLEREYQEKIIEVEKRIQKELEEEYRQKLSAVKEKVKNQVLAKLSTKKNNWLRSMRAESAKQQQSGYSLKEDNN